MGYFLTILIISILYIFSRDKKQNLTAAFIIVVAMILLNGLRGLDVGRDTINYYMMYTNPSISERIEPLFRGLILTSRYFGLSYNCFLLIVAILIYAPLYRFIKNQSMNPCLSLLVYMVFSVFFMQNSYNVLRNAIAASFLLNGIAYLRTNNYKRSSLPILIAAGFHYSSIVVLPFLFMSKVMAKMKPNIAILLILISVFIGLSSTFYDNLFTSVLQQFYMFSGSVSDNYSIYLSEISETEVNTNGLIMLIAPMSLVSILSFLDKKVDVFYRMILFFGVFLGNLFVSVLYTYRLTVFMTLIVIIVIPQLVIKDKKDILLTTYGIVLAMTVYYIYMLSTGAANNIVPYKFYFE